MIEPHMGILKPSVMGNILPSNENCPAAGQPLVVRCWNYLLTHVEERLHGIKDDPNTSENAGQNYRSLPRVVLSVLIFFLSWWSGEKRPEQWTVLDVRFFSLLAKAESFLSSFESVIWRPPFPSASWLVLQSNYPHSQTCHRWHVWWWFLVFSFFISNAVVMSNIHVPICVFRSWALG